ncbi:sulfatase family protein [Novipirellula artificiosorum]|uniref:Arylsulfatase n=1 Tax=Novipirellula artificiosorum TaxID=2528016 RepID=A0A5C6E4J3_9BACT|nr:sulfatase-like hydrolase/transferase [Novipirellula artificiosorum]TWU42356.1 Arylsulfatase precursor [Novipirellula artificiosorum]
MKTIVSKIALALFLTLAFSSTRVLADQTRPNLVVILCDDLGYSDVGFNGATDIKTPKLDQLALGGTVCISAYVTHPFCGPSRMGLMSGRYPHSFGGPYNLPPDGNCPEGIPESETLISTVLKRAGYFTGAVGKWHMGVAAPFHPNQRGFDDYYGFLGGGHEYFPSHYRPIYDRQRNNGVANIREYVRPLEHNGKEVKEDQYITDALSREAVRFVNEAAAKEQPFFLYLAYNAPHTPLQAKEEDMLRFANIDDSNRRTYAAMVYAVDRGVGQLVDALLATSQLDKTLIVFLSDNGGKLSAGATNVPLREGKGSVYEGGFRVPMFFHWPGTVAAGKRFAHPVSTLDLYPTFARLAQASIPAGKQLDGKDIWDALLDGRNPRSGETIFALRHRNGYSDVGVRQDQWKACRVANQPWKLFNIEQDIVEQHDVGLQHPTTLRQMVRQAERWSQTHTQARWFDSPKVKDGWQAANMPNYDETFRIDK